MMQIIETLNEERAKLIKDSINEGKKKCEIKHIKNMLKENLSIELISKITEMTESEIKRISIK